MDNNSREKWLVYLNQFINQSIMKLYQSNFNGFYASNPNLNSFIQNHQQYINNQEAFNTLRTFITDQDYMQILGQLKKNYVNPISDSNDRIVYVPLSEIPTQLLDEENKEIYEEAVSMAMRQEDSHNVKIGQIKSNSDKIYLMRRIKNTNGKFLDWQKNEEDTIVYDNDKGKQMILVPTKSRNEGGFSTALIMSFIIGSIIGILFLFFYSKYIK